MLIVLISLLLVKRVGRWSALFVVLAVGALPAAGFDGVAGFIESYCVQCHGGNKEQGGVTLHDLGSNFEEEETVDRWLEVLSQLTTGDMPPRDATTFPSGPLRRSVIHWIETNLESSDRAESSSRVNGLRNFGLKAALCAVCSMFSGSVGECKY